MRILRLIRLTKEALWIAWIALAWIATVVLLVAITVFAVQRWPSIVQKKPGTDFSTAQRWKLAKECESDDFRTLTGGTEPDGAVQHSEPVAACESDDPKHAAKASHDALLPPKERIPPKSRTGWTRPRVGVYASPIPQAQATLRDLTDGGQSHAIDFLAQNTDASPHSWDDLRKALTGENASKRTDDPFRFDRILVTTITKGVGAKPGDRMMWTRVFVQPINFRFAGYSVAATENETAKITNIQTTNSRKLSAQAEIGMPGLKGTSASISPSDEHTINTSSEITAQYERLGIDITPDFLRIIRESESGGDAVGNTTVTLSMVTDPVAIRRQFPKTKNHDAGDDESKNDNEDQNGIALLMQAAHLEENGADLKPEKASLTVVPRPQLPHCPLLARVWMLYELRHITAGGEFYDEFQQTVQVSREASKPADVEIMSADDVAPFWYVRIVRNNQQDAKSPPRKSAGEKSPNANAADAKVRLVLGAQLAGDENAPIRDIIFTDYGLASNVARWVRRNPAAVVQGLKFVSAEGASLVPFRKIDHDPECLEPPAGQGSTPASEAAK